MSNPRLVIEDHILTFLTGKAQRPLDWRSPETVATLFDLMYRLDADAMPRIKAE